MVEPEPDGRYPPRADGRLRDVAISAGARPDGRGRSARRRGRRGPRSSFASDLLPHVAARVAARRARRGGELSGGDLPGLLADDLRPAQGQRVSEESVGADRGRRGGSARPSPRSVHSGLRRRSRGRSRALRSPRRRRVRGSARGAVARPRRLRREGRACARRARGAARRRARVVNGDEVPDPAAAVVADDDQRRALVDVDVDGHRSRSRRCLAVEDRRHGDFQTVRRSARP